MIENARRRIIENIKRLEADVLQLERDNDVIGCILAGGALTLTEAADIKQCCDETMRKECEQATAEDQPIGIKLQGHWILGTTRLLDRIEQTDGRPARLAAEDRAKKYASWTSRQPQQTR